MTDCVTDIDNDGERRVKFENKRYKLIKVFLVLNFYLKKKISIFYIYFKFILARWFW
jgi:hypothetical protein